MNRRFWQESRMKHLTAKSSAVFFRVLLVTLLAPIGDRTANGSANQIQPNQRNGSEVRFSSASEQPPSAGHSLEVKRLIQAAKRRGESDLDLVWGEMSFGGHRGAKLFQALFRRMYGMDINVNFTPGPRMPDTVAKITQEVASGQKASTDILLGTETHYASLTKRDVLEAYDFTRLSPRISIPLLAPRGIGVEIATFVSGITYNANYISKTEAPKRLEDVLNPKWKGKIASTPYAAQFDRIALLPSWGVDRMRAFLTRLAGNLGGLIRCGESARIVTGEFIMMVMDCGTYYARLEQAKGAPLENVILEDGATMSFFYWGVPRTSAHPNLAKLFIDMAMSREGQELVYKVHATDHSALPGSRSAAEINDLRSRGVQILRVDAKFVADHPELRELSNDLQKILRERGGR